MSQAWAQVWSQYSSNLSQGAVAPDQVFRDFYNHVYHPATGYGGAPRTVEKWYGYLVGNLSAGNYETAVFSAGVMSHYIADVANPLHTDSSDAEDAIHSKYETDVSQHLSQITVGIPRLDSVANITAYVISTAESSHEHYWALVSNYTQSGWNTHIENITVTYINLAIKATASLWASAIQLGAAKIPTTISISMSKSTVTDGEEITISGSIVPNPGEVNVTLTYKKPDGTSITTTLKTTAEGSYTDTFKPTPKGSWNVTASWTGSETHGGATSPTVSFAVKGWPCIIATATYESELSLEVQFLRDFRDQVVLSAFAGSQFMKLFNAWYYSFSPGVANFIAEHPIMRSAMKATIYPLIGVLHVATLTYACFSFNNEVGVLMAGLVASSIIGIVYFSPLLAALLLAFKQLRKAFNANSVKALSMAWLLSVALIIIGEVSLSPTIMMVAAGAFVLATLSLSAMLGAMSITGLAQK